MKLFNQELTKDELRQRVGHISQIAGTKRYLLKEGRGEGVEAIDVKTGSGLYFTVLPGRSMDIAWVEYQGKPIAHIGKPGITNSQYYNIAGTEWLRSFFEGMLTTCGLTHVGPPQQEGQNILGMHGRISNTPAEAVEVETAWKNEKLFMRIKGTMRESVLFGENLSLTREITTGYGKKCFHIEDHITNEGYDDTPFMILYHMNMGYPIVSEFSHLIAPVIKAYPRDDEAGKGLEIYDLFEKPTHGYAEQVFYHELAGDKDGNTCVGIINNNIQFGAYIAFNKKELPHFNEWKMMGQQDYVVGLEPGNCAPEGRISARENGTLEYLKPGEVRRITIEVGILDGEEDINTFKSRVSSYL